MQTAFISVSFSFAIVRLDEAEGMTYPDAGKQKSKEAKNFGDMRSEVLEMQQICEKLESPIVFTHNDLLSGNVMIPLEASMYSPCALQPALHLHDAYRLPERHALVLLCATEVYDCCFCHSVTQLLC